MTTLRKATLGVALVILVPLSLVLTLPLAGWVLTALVLDCRERD